MKRFLAGLAVLGLAMTVAWADDAKPGTPKLKPVAVAISHKLDPARYGYSTSSVALSLEVETPGKQLLGVDASSAVTEFKDDRGTSLMSTGFSKTKFAESPRIANDRTAMIVFVNSFNVAPVQGATKMILKGSLVARCGIEPKTTEEKEIEFKMNAETQMGDYKLKITQEKGFGTFGGTFVITSATSNIKSVSIKDADGKPVEISSSTSYGFGKNWTHSYSLKKPVAKAKIAITYFSKEEPLTIPVDLTVSLGL